MTITIKCISVILISIILGLLAANFRKEYYSVLDADSEKIAIPSLLKLKDHKAAAIFCGINIMFSIGYLFLIKDRDINYLTIIENIVVWELFFLIAIIDFQKKKIPNFLIIALIVIRIIGIAIACILSPSETLNIILFSIIGFLVGGFIILACMLISRGGVGAGDMKLFAVSGLYFGLPGVMAIMMYSLLFAAITSIVLLITRRAKMKSTLAMAPFIFIGLSIYLIFTF